MPKLILSVSATIFPVSCLWSTKLPKTPKHSHTYITYRSFKKFDKDHFLSDLSEIPFGEVYNETDPDTALSVWYTLFLPVLDKHAPIRRKRVKNRAQPQWLSKEIVQAMKYRDDLRRQKCFADFKIERKRVKNLIRQARKTVVDKLIQENNDTSTLWRAMAVVTGDSRKNSKPIPPELSADKFNSHFLSIADSLAPSTGDSQSYTCPDVLVNFCTERMAGSTDFFIPPIAIHEVGKLISSMPNKKSSGPDEISPKILKLSLPFTVESLTYIYNLCILNNTFPDRLKLAKVIPIPKSKDMSDINNFRPISLLSVVSKPIERHVHRHILGHLEKHNLIHPLQSGFRPKHSCHTALARLTDTWLSAMDDGHMTGTVFIDLKKAFDLVNHTILIEKLKVYLTGTPPRSSQGAHSWNESQYQNTMSDAVVFLQSYLNNRIQQVSVNGSLSSSGIVTRGVPQGSVLGPLFFCMFINDLPLHLTSDNISCDLFADDASIHTPDRDVDNINERLQKGLVTISAWCEHNSMVLNPKKTESMVIATRQRHQLSPLALKLSVDSHPVAQVTEHRLLGVIIDSQLKWQSHINQVCKNVSRNVFLLSKLKQFVDKDTRKMFFNAHIRSHIDYCSTVWDGSSEVHLKRLDSLYRRAAKQILPDPTLTTDEKLCKLDILPLSQHLIFNKGVMMYKIWYGTVPPYLSDLFTKAHSKCRNSRNNFTVPRPRLDIYKTSLSFSGSSLWNALPPRVKARPLLSSYKASLFRYLMLSKPP